MPEDKVICVFCGKEIKEENAVPHYHAKRKDNQQLMWGCKNCPSNKK